ncbi:hypothetical protein [Arsukibacterium sp.]|uniref:hypothetical protein n=1 Tax=Arsukibacterium sp. TaxID=1977258 RepID=UPI002FD9C623
MTELDRFITQLKQQDIAVYLLINPYQQPYLDQLTEYQLDQHLGNWKAQMIQLAKHHQLPLFDFAINSKLVTDVVAPNSKVTEDSPYFWEPAHYRPAFGDLILNSLLKNNCHHVCKLYSQ